MRDFNNAFKTTFINAITPDKSKKEIIFSAVTQIKQTLSEELNKLHSRKPRFMTQGSAGYKTQNAPCHPEQQIDYDIGCYFPFSEWEDEKPKRAAKEFFMEVDTILEKLAQTNNWELDKSKNTCCRVIIEDDIHIDIPLYSIPDDEFKTITESAESRKSFSTMDSMEPQEESWDNFNFDKVLLAQREGDWIESDPRKVNLYFKDAFEKKGEQFRRLCRYLKAWRDFKWKSGGPSSIFLMFLADDLYEKNVDDGDDSALYLLLTKIPGRLNTPILNNAVYNDEKKENLTERNIKYIENLKEFSSNFATDLGKAIYDESMNDISACKLIQRHLGNRFPCCPIPERKKKISDEIRKEPISTTSSNPLIRTRAGR